MFGANGDYESGYEDGFNAGEDAAHTGYKKEIARLTAELAAAREETDRSRTDLLAAMRETEAEAARVLLRETNEEGE